MRNFKQQIPMFRILAIPNCKYSGSWLFQIAHVQDPGYFKQQMFRILAISNSKFSGSWLFQIANVQDPGYFKQQIFRILAISNRKKFQVPGYLKQRMFRILAISNSTCSLFRNLLIYCMNYANHCSIPTKNETFYKKIEDALLKQCTFSLV